MESKRILIFVLHFRPRNFYSVPRLQLEELPRKTFCRDVNVESRPNWGSYESMRTFAGYPKGEPESIDLRFIDAWDATNSLIRANVFFNRLSS